MRVLWCAFKVLQHGEPMASFWKDNIITNDLKNDSASVAAEEVICERINIESTNKFLITEWREQ